MQGHNIQKCVLQIEKTHMELNAINLILIIQNVTGTPHSL